MIKIERTFISLFGGIGGFDKPLIERGWECKGYYDIDKYATAVYNKNFGTNWKARDIRNVGTEEIPEHTLLTAGFPCQSFSIAGKRMGFEETRGTLFFEIARIIKAKQPQYLLLENVKGILSHDSGKTITTIFSTLDELGYNAEWEIFNSRYFGVPQNRERIYIVGHLRGRSSRQILPIGQNFNQLSKTNGGKQTISESGISSTLKAQYYKISADSTYIVDGEKKVKRLAGLYDDKEGTHQAGSIYDINGLAPTLDDAQGGYREPLIVASRAFPRTGTKEIDGDRNQQLEPRFDGCTNTLTGVEKDNLVVTGNLTNYKIRRLTPTECERLQGFPSGWTAKGIDESGKEIDISDTQRYKMAGNAVSTPVVAAIVDALNKTLEETKNGP